MTQPGSGAMQTSQKSTPAGRLTGNGHVVVGGDHHDAPEREGRGVSRRTFGAFAGVEAEFAFWQERPASCPGRSCAALVTP